MVLQFLIGESRLGDDRETSRIPINMALTEHTQTQHKQCCIIYNSSVNVYTSISARPFSRQYKGLLIPTLKRKNPKYTP